ncbi:hypothetical protein [Hymenobacter sp. B81]|uniref:hypothetical protein n=1 Tax=Hymenobacter sp. B81 TaxID=3344878 RepID=UPI0037DD9BE9
MPAYQSYFDHFFATLPLSRVNFKASGTSTLAALREADLGTAFAPHLTELEAALAGFDDALTEADAPTAGDTAAFRAARKAWLAFVDDTMKDYVTPKLRRLPAYADFRRYGKSRLAALAQADLLQDSQQLLALYTEHAAALGRPTLPAEARAAYQPLPDAWDARDTTDAGIAAARTDLSADWLALARALRRVKAQLELRFDEPAEVYRFFDFSKVRKARRPEAPIKVPAAIVA